MPGRPGREPAATLVGVQRDDLDDLLDGHGQFTDEPGYGDGVPDICWACNRHPAGDGPSGACPECRRRLRGDEPFTPQLPHPPVGAHVRKPGAGRARQPWTERRRLRDRADEEGAART
jgi:hypothetical protein